MTGKLGCLPACGCAIRWKRAQATCLAVTILSLTTLFLGNGVLPSRAAARADSPTPSAGSRVSVPDRVVDFRTEIWPIFKARCFGCHGPDQQRGQLRLDSLASIESGGHTGHVILGTLDDSELLRRIRSSDDGYRMPKDEVPLDARELESIEAWIAQGAHWNAPSLLEQARNAAAPNDWNHVLERFAFYQQQIGFLGYPSMVLLVAILWNERRKRTHRHASELGYFGRIGYVHYLAAFLIIALFAMGVLLRHAQRELQAMHAVNLEGYQLGITEFGNNGQIPRPIHPLHPPRLGGRYYRGNDERNEELFNFGFYRTATFDLELQNEAGDRLHRGDAVEQEPIYVSLRISRAPGTTRELFRDESLQRTELTRQIPFTNTRQFADTPVPMEVVQPGEVWAARYKIVEPMDADHPSPAMVNGLLYLVPRGARAHYGIQYDLEIQENRIAETSELWMGAILLSGQVIQHERHEIPIAQWFGFQPIPEIQGKNTDDPGLLGITEHEKSAGDPHRPRSSAPTTQRQHLE